MVSSLLERIPREMPRSFHLPARSATADFTSRRSSSSASKDHTVLANTTVDENGHSVILSISSLDIFKIE